MRASENPAEPNPVWLVEAPDQATSNAPWRLLNVGNSLPVSIEELIAALEHALDKTAIKEYITGPILEKSQSCADVSALQLATQFRPATPLVQGIAEFAAWYRMYHQV